MPTFIRLFLEWGTNIRGLTSHDKAENFTALRASRVLGRGFRFRSTISGNFGEATSHRACMYVHDENVMQRSREITWAGRTIGGRIASTRHRAIVFSFVRLPRDRVGHHQPARVNVQIAIGKATRTFLLLASRPVASAMKLPLSLEI